MKKTFTLGGKEVTLATATTNEAEAQGLGIEKNLTVREFNKRLVVASLRSAGDLEATLQSVGEHAFFPQADDSLDAYVQAAFEVNGISTAGEKQPAGPATSDSTLTGSTSV